MYTDLFILKSVLSVPVLVPVFITVEDSQIKLILCLLCKSLDVVKIIVKSHQRNKCEKKKR